MPKTILNCRDRLNWVSIVTKTKYDNYVIDRIEVVYAKNETKLLQPIKPGPVYVKN